MDADKKAITTRLKEAGLSQPLIDAAWPAWWSEEAYSSPSAQAELRFSLARKLGLSPTSLCRDDVEFVWKDDARFKSLSSVDTDERAALTSFGLSTSRMLVKCTRAEFQDISLTARQLRKAILTKRPFVDLQSLISACWALGLPVIHLRLFPLKVKRMHAMVVRVAERYAVLLAKDAQYPAHVAFTLAHELGHIFLGHVLSTAALADFDDPMAGGDDEEEVAADKFALELLTGRQEPEFETSTPTFTSWQLATAVLESGPEVGIEPGTLALCLGYSRKMWPIAVAAMKYIYSEPKDVSHEVNQIAMTELDFDSLGEDAAGYLQRVMGVINE